MPYIDVKLSQRFAESCTTAAFGYARAATAAYAAFASQALDYWMQAPKSVDRADYKPATPYLVTGPRPYRAAVTPTPIEAALPFDFAGLSQSWPSSRMLFAPVRAWWGLFPLEGNPKSWPMAYAMMTAGVPRAVALPAAEANVAAMDAAEAASASINRVFSSTRGNEGFAASPISESSNAMLKAFLFTPFATLVKLPWA